jgi:hypothetical protein
MNWSRAFLISAILSAVASCGTMKVRETHYYAVEDENNTNVFRLKITATSVLGEAKYQSGYFPSSAVDRVFGDIKGAGGTEELQIHESLATEIRSATLKTTKRYLQIASNPKSTYEEIQKALNVRRTILAYPSLNSPLPIDSRIIDYVPGRGIVLKNSDSKMVFVFSSNPDDVIGNIKNFAESDQTALAVSRLAQVTLQQTSNDVAEQEAILTVTGEGISAQIGQTAKRLSQEGDSDKIIMIEQLAILRAYMKGAQP